MAESATVVAGGVDPLGRTIRYAGIGDEAADTLGGQLDALNVLGWSAIELRTVDGVGIGDLDDRAFSRLAATLDARGTDVVCAASQIGNWSRPITGDFGRDLAELATLAPRCRALGAPFVRVMSWAGDGLTAADWGRRAIARMRELTLRAEQAGVVLVHENCTGWASVEAERMLRLVEAVDSPAFGLLFDTGNGLAYGYHALDVLAETVEHVRHVHVKDVRGSRGAPVYTAPGTGSARVADCLRLLLAGGYAGAWSIEPHVVLRPHEAATAGSDADRRLAGRRDGFLACGRALEELVRREILVGAPTSRAPGGPRVGDFEL